MYGEAAALCSGRISARCFLLPALLSAVLRTAVPWDGGAKLPFPKVD